MSTTTFDEQVAALRGKVAPVQFKGRKPEATPEQWASHLDYAGSWRSANAESERVRGREYKRRTYLANRDRILARARSYRLKNASVVRERNRKYRAENREESNAQRRRWKSANPEKVREGRRRYVAAMKAGDVPFKIAYALRYRLSNAVRGSAKSGSAVRDLGCSIGDLKAHLERQFQPGMTWDNWGKGPGKWQIDHIYPLAKTDLTDRPQLLAVCNWQNLQPLWEPDNIRKGDTVTPDAQALFDRLRAEFSRATVA